MADKRHLGANLPTFKLIIALPQFLPKGSPLACVRQMCVYSPYTQLSETSSAKNISSQDYRKDSNIVNWIQPPPPPPQQKTQHLRLSELY